MKKLMALLAACCMLCGCLGVEIVPAGSDGTKVLEKNIIVTDPDEKVVLNIVDWSDSTREERQALNERFEADHPNVTINYTCLSQDQFNETVIAGIRSGSAPDLFPLPSTLSLSQAVAEGWFVPLDWYLDEDFLQQMKGEIWAENITTMEGDAYLLPEAQEINTTLLYYNKKILQEAGIQLDPAVPMTWSEFLSVCHTIDEAGQGKYYALVASGRQKNRIELELRALAQLNGAVLGPADQLFLQDGSLTFDSEKVQEAFALYEALYEQGSFHPDSASLTAPEARKRFAEGKAAFIIQGAWCIPVWEAEDPQLDFGVTRLPVPDDNPSAKAIAPFTKGWMGISASSQHPDVAAEYLEYLYAYDYQKSLVDKGGFVSIRADLDENAISDPIMKDYYALSVEQSEQMENPVSVHTDNQLVYDLMQSVTPDFGDIAASVLSGSKDYEKKLEAYTLRMQDNLLKAVHAAGMKGSVSLEDFEVTRP